MTEEELAAEWETITAADKKNEANAGQSDEDKLAAEWAAAMETGGEGTAEGLSDDEKLAAEWAASTEGAGDDTSGASEIDAVAGGTDRELSQDEIDSLLGFGDESASNKELVGVHALIQSALGSYERLPMLEVVFDSLARLMATSLRNLTSGNVDVSLSQMRSVRFGDYLDSIPLPAMLIVFKAEEWENSGIMTIDSSLIYSFVDVLLGGRQGAAPVRIEGRPYSTIERNLIKRIALSVLSDVAAAFKPITTVNFHFERLETNPRFATITRPANAAILVETRIKLEDRSGKLELLLPYATLDPVRELLLRRYTGNRFARDPVWGKHLAREVKRSSVELDAVLDEVAMPLEHVLDMQVGQQILLNATPESKVHVRCDGVPIFEGRMGRSGSRIAVQIDQRLRPATPAPE